MPTAVVAKAPAMDAQPTATIRPRRKSMSLETSTARVCVGVRIRPLGPKEPNEKLCVNTSSSAPNSIKLLNNNKTFTFDHVFPCEATQDDVYQTALRPMMDSLLEGFNVTVIAYGQTGSGKTHTMGNGVVDQPTEASITSSPRQLVRKNSRRNSITALPKQQQQQQQQQQPYEMKDADGLIPRFLHDFFQCLDQNETTKPKISVSFLEIYGEELHDLLVSNKADNDRSNLTIREDKHDVWVEGLREIPVTKCEEALYQMQLGRGHQITGSNGINDNSSRSHAVFTVTIERQMSLDSISGANASHKRTSSTSSLEAVSHGKFISKLTFVDLAGSERLKKTHSEGNTKKEGIQINVGLLALGNVINALGDEAKGNQRNNSTNSFVPYRSSKLTRYLRDALGGNSRTLFIACVAPGETNSKETLNTLQYANRARNIQNKAEKNTVELSPSALEIAKLQIEIFQLRKALEEASALNQSESKKLIEEEPNIPVKVQQCIDNNNTLDSSVQTEVQEEKNEPKSSQTEPEVVAVEPEKMGVSVEIQTEELMPEEQEAGFIGPQEPPPSPDVPSPTPTIQTKLSEVSSASITFAPPPFELPQLSSPLPLSLTLPLEAKTDQASSAGPSSVEDVRESLRRGNPFRLSFSLPIPPIGTSSKANNVLEEINVDIPAKSATEDETTTGTEHSLPNSFRLSLGFATPSAGISLAMPAPSLVATVPVLEIPTSISTPVQPNVELEEIKEKSDFTFVKPFQLTLPSTSSINTKSKEPMEDSTRSKKTRPSLTFLFGNNQSNRRRSHTIDILTPTSATPAVNMEDLKSLQVLAQWSRQVLEDFGESRPPQLEKLKSPRTIKNLVYDLKELATRREEVEKRIQKSISRLGAMEDAMKPDPKVDLEEIRKSGKFTLLYQEKLLEAKLVAYEKLASMRLKKRIETRRQASQLIAILKERKPPPPPPLPSSKDEKEEEEELKLDKNQKLPPPKRLPFLTDYQVKACAEWNEELGYDDEFFIKHILALLRNGWISLSEKELEADQRGIQELEQEIVQADEKSLNQMEEEEQEQPEEVEQEQEQEEGTILDKVFSGFSFWKRNKSRY